MAEKVKRWLERLSAEHPILSSSLIAAIAAVFVIGGTLWVYGYDPEFKKNIAVEAHGMLFDLVVIGVIVLWFNRLGERRLSIRRYQEEIEDYLGWDEKEAMYRIVGNIRRLNRERFTKINLSGAYLQKASLSGAKLHGAKLRGANLQGANLLDADLSGGILNGARLDEANLTSAILSEATLLGATLRGARLIEADLSKTDLRGTNLRGAKYNSKEYYQIVDRVNDVAISYQPTQWPDNFDPVAVGAFDVSEQPDYPPWLSKRIEDAHWR